MVLLISASDYRQKPWTPSKAFIFNGDLYLNVNMWKENSEKSTVYY
jgi:hypothetical protein